MAAREATAVVTFTPGIVISRRTSTDPTTCSAISRSWRPISRSRNSICLSAPSTVSRSSAGRLDPLQPGVTAPAEQVGGWRFAHQLAVQRRVDLVLGGGSLLEQLCATGHEPPEQTGLLIRRPHAEQEPRCQGASPGCGRRCGRSSPSPTTPARYSDGRPEHPRSATSISVEAGPKPMRGRAGTPAFLPSRSARPPL